MENVMEKVMYKVDEVIDLIQQNKRLLLSGDESLLKQLPKGNWIAGTIPYFMAEEGGVCTKDEIQVTEIPEYAEEIKCITYDIASIKNVYKDGYENGYTVLIIPGLSDAHLSFAINAPDYKQFATKPLIGWISGVQLDELSKVSPKTYFGPDAVLSDKNAVAMHVKLPTTKYAEISITNLFKQGYGDTIEFVESGFCAKEAIINGKLQNFAEYVTLKDIDTRLPLVADYNGIMINISFQNIDCKLGCVKFYAPVFTGMEYQLALPVNNYIEQFTDLIKQQGIEEVAFSCNCILNYLYSELEGKKTGNITGPITFGEIAYQLLNQTMVNLEIKDI